ncbi:MFS transporter [Spirochaetota bacterium]
MDKNEKKILVFTSAVHFLTHFFMLVFPALVMSISRDLSIPLDRVLAISFLHYLCYGLLALPWGYLSDRFGPRWIMGAGVLVSGIGFIMASFTTSINGLSICLGIVGLGCSAYHPSGLALISKGIKVRGRALGINGIWGNLGIAGGPFAAGILSFLLNWQNALRIFGFFGVIAGVICFIVPFSVERESELQKGTTVEKGHAVKLFLIICVSMFFSGLMYRGFTLILPTFMEFKLAHILANLKGFFAEIFTSVKITRDVDTLFASVITGCVFLVGMAGQYIGGKMADKKDLRFAYLSFFSLAFPFLILLSVLDGVFIIFSSGMFALFSLGMQPIENSLVAMLTPPKWRSLSYGLKFSIVFGAGSLSVWLVSYVSKIYGLNSVILLLSSYLVFVIFTILILIISSRGQPIKHKT